MGISSRHASAGARTPSYLLPAVLIVVFFTVVFLYKVNDFATRTKTLAGHNLEPTPWHFFPPKTFDEESLHGRAYKIIQCSYLTCPHNLTTATNAEPQRFEHSYSQSPSECPEFFRYIHRDLEPWARTKITENHIMQAKNFAAFRVVIYQGRLYSDLYYACVQSRMMFTIWGLLQLLKRYPGMVPDVDMMFDCMDKPTINRTEHESMPLPLFRYCTTQNHFDIPFPDWSFWGWPEVNIKPWDEEFKDIKQGSQARSWSMKVPRAFWKGNPDVVSPIRSELMQCNHSKWGARIIRQDWLQEAKDGYEKSKLSNQCQYQYKIYAEGYAWSVSLKYIVSCGSLTLIISPQYEDFFSRGLIAKKNYWPVFLLPTPDGLCRSVKFAVDWGNSNPSEAQRIGKRGQNFMETLSMERVYDYMFHLIKEYSKMQDFKPVPPSSALQVCEDSLLCLADQKQRHFLEMSSTSASPNPPCTLQPADVDAINSLLLQKQKLIEDVRQMETPV